MALDNRTQNFGEFNGLITVQDPIEIGFKAFTKAENIDITADKKIKRRKGNTASLAATIDSAYIDDEIFLYTTGANLYQYDGTISTLIRTDLRTGGNIAAHTLNGKTYYSDGFVTGVISGGVSRSLGLNRPGSAVLSATTGNLPKGRYQVVLTYERDNGQESGAGDPALINLTEDNSGIIFNSIPMSSDVDVEKVNVYLTTTDGMEYFLAAVVDNGFSSATFRDTTHALQKPLLGQYHKPIPAFTDAASYNGRMLYACGDTVVYSEPFDYEERDERYNFIILPEAITMIAPGENGVFIGTTKRTNYYSGSDIAQASVDDTTNAGVVPGTLSYIPAEYFGTNEGVDSLPMWTSHKGICIGQADGSIVNITARKVDVLKGLKGTAMFRHEDGQNHYVSVINS